MRSELRIGLALLLLMTGCSDTTLRPLADGRPDGDPGSDGARRDGTGRDRTSDGASSTIWRPKPLTTWQWQLTGSLDTSVKATMYDLDLFNLSAATVATLHAAHRIVICYFSAGSYEGWRPDAASIPAAARGKTLEGWGDEQWLDVRSPAVRQVMAKRLDLARSKGCDGVEPDNVDGYANDSGFPLSAGDQLDFNRFLAREAHLRGLSVGLKNDLDQIPQLEPDFDWALNEQCLEFDECDQLAPFIAANKAVFHVEYTPADRDAVCAKVAPLKLSTLIKNLDLDAWFQACWS